MTRTERAAYYEQSLFGPTALVWTAARAGVDQWANRPTEWRQGASGYGWRAGSAYAEWIIGQSFQHGYALGLHEDNRYFALGGGGFAKRVGYALSSAVLARHDDGSRSLSLSAIGGAASGAFIARTWQPRSNTRLADAPVQFGFTIGVNAALNLMREFSPRVLGRALQ